MGNELPILSLKECLTYLPARPRDAHKGCFGHVLILGGDYGFGGAVGLAGEAALRSGAGLVSVATVPEHAYTLVGNCPELMAHGIINTEDLAPLITRATVIVAGPGLGAQAWGKRLLSQCLESKLPLVLDADALNILSSHSLDLPPQAKRQWILTPHPGEASRLLKRNIDEIQADRIQAIQDLQSMWGGIIVLKGAKTLVIDEQGEIYASMISNPGMAIPGTGDVLSGILGALIAQKLTLSQAAKLAVIAHALAGDEAARMGGERGMKASDLFLPIRAYLN